MPPGADAPPWPHIHDLEVREDYPAAIDALEARLGVDPADDEAVRRLGFNLWFAVIEHDRLAVALPTERYAIRFVELFRRYAHRLANDADFCWSFGLGISMFWYRFPGATEEEGHRLLERARHLDPMWQRLQEPGTDLSRLRGRGIFAAYYKVV